MHKRVAYPEVPDSIRIRADEEMILKVHATGFQIYVCEASADRKPAWILKGVKAELADEIGIPVGSHSSGPIWTHSDGSEIAGRVTGRADAPDARSIPWLLLSAYGHTGAGILSRVTSIRRTCTSGGQAPDHCDGSDSGTEIRIPYSADYYFYGPGR